MDDKKILLTGDRPTGRLHLGHYVGSLRNRVELQKREDIDKFFIMIADTQALTDNYGNPAKVKDNIIQVALDDLACGISKDKACIFIQSQVPELFELTCYFLDLVTVSRLERNPTVKNEIQQKGFEESIPAGFLTYPVSQASDILAFDTDIVPVGEDQAPMIEQTNEIARRFNYLYGDTFKEVKMLLPENRSACRLPGTDGKSKMSKSLNNCIYISDDENTVNQKVKTMFTDPLHLRVEDPGHTDNNPVFIYLDALVKDEDFKMYYSKFANFNQLKEAYEKGGVGDVEIKQFLAKVINNTLSPIRERRKEFEKDISSIYRMLEENSKRASFEASKKLKQVRRHLSVDYFTDYKFIEKQQKAFNKEHRDEENLKAHLAKKK